ncbi:hypothetical protein BJ742DRAFT_299775 [Cladochytrium replicatum]|nr:hypothetical protein BJ742DRAFT_299775 [Cladochytrium replicatum]
MPRRRANNSYRGEDHKFARPHRYEWDPNAPRPEKRSRRTTQPVYDENQDDEAFEQMIGSDSAPFINAFVDSNLSAKDAPDSSFDNSFDSKFDNFDSGVNFDSDNNGLNEDDSDEIAAESGRSTPTLLDGGLDGPPITKPKKPVGAFSTESDRAIIKTSIYSTVRNTLARIPAAILTILSFILSCIRNVTGYTVRATGTLLHNLWSLVVRTWESERAKARTEVDQNQSKAILFALAFLIIASFVMRADKNSPVLQSISQTIQETTRDVLGSIGEVPMFLSSSLGSTSSTAASSVSGAFSAAGSGARSLIRTLAGSVEDAAGEFGSLIGGAFAQNLPRRIDFSGIKVPSFSQVWSKLSSMTPYSIELTYRRYDDPFHSVRREINSYVQEGSHVLDLSGADGFMLNLRLLKDVPNLTVTLVEPDVFQHETMIEACKVLGFTNHRNLFVLDNYSSLRRSTYNAIVAFPTQPMGDRKDVLALNFQRYLVSNGTLLFVGHKWQEMLGSSWTFQKSGTTFQHIPWGIAKHN